MPKNSVYMRPIIPFCACARLSPALREGAFFDVMYVNYQSISGFDPNRHYAFLRKTTDEAILAVANFSDQDISVGVKLPAHASTICIWQKARLRRVI